MRIGIVGGTGNISRASRPDRRCCHRSRAVNSSSFGILYDLYHSVTEGEDMAAELAEAGTLVD